jgi:hypothetical protein
MSRLHADPLFHILGTPTPQKKQNKKEKKTSSDEIQVGPGYITTTPNGPAQTLVRIE